jgi:hypothetical protein
MGPSMIRGLPVLLWDLAVLAAADKARAVDATPVNRWRFEMFMAPIPS